MSDEAQIMQILQAQPDEGYYQRRGKIMQGKAQDVEIYLRGDEHIEEDGAYIKIFAGEGTVYIAREMIEKLRERIGDISELEGSIWD